MATKLKKLITMPPQPRLRFREFVKNFMTAYDIKIQISERAFVTENKNENLNKDIVLPAINNQPIGEVLNQAFTQIDATSIIIRDTVLVVPAGKGNGGPMGNPPPGGMGGNPPGGMRNPPPP